MENENERSVIAAALDEALRSVRSDRRDLTRRGKWGSTRLDCRPLASRAHRREVRPSRKAYRVDERDVSGPVVLRQAVDAQPSTKTAAFELNEVVPQRRE